jgi:hypothetical protein
VSGTAASSGANVSSRTYTMSSANVIERRIPYIVQMQFNLSAAEIANRINLMDGPSGAEPVTSQDVQQKIDELLASWDQR